MFFYHSKDISASRMFSSLWIQDTGFLSGNCRDRGWDTHAMEFPALSRRPVGQETRRKPAWAADPEETTDDCLSLGTPSNGPAPLVAWGTSNVYHPSEGTQGGTAPRRQDRCSILFSFPCVPFMSLYSAPRLWEESVKAVTPSIFLPVTPGVQTQPVPREKPNHLQDMGRTFQSMVKLWTFPSSLL